MSDIHVVDSKEHMLNPDDIFIVAAHEYTQGLDEIKSYAEQAGVSPERLQYSIFLNEYSNPHLVRYRAGNTLFTITPFENRVGFVRSYNADTAKNYINNVVEFIEAAYKLGFDVLMSQAHTEEMRKMLDIAEKRTNNPNIKTSFDPQTKWRVSIIGTLRG